jgi:exopolysaccharide biosynthesis polyprenyl glycosylphosphotransferase
MFGGGRQAADGGVRDGVGPSPGLMLTTSSADALISLPGRPVDIDPPGRPVLVAVPERGRVVAPPSASPPRRRATNALVLLGADFVAALVGTAVAYRAEAGWATPSPIMQWVPLVVMPSVWLLVLGVHHGYDAAWARGAHDDSARVARSFVHLGAVLAGAWYVFDVGPARDVALVALPLTAALDLAARWGVRLVDRRRAGAAPMRRVLAVGDAASVVAFSEQVSGDRCGDVVVSAACVVDAKTDDLGPLDDLGLPVLGELDTVAESALRIGADAVTVLPSTHLDSERLRRIAWQLEGTDIDLLVSPGLAEVAGQRLRVRSVAWVPLVQLRQPQFRGLPRVLKGMFDRVLALCAVVVLLPVFAVIALLVRLSSPGPALFRQTRVGRDGRTFPMLKFRSMFVDAESRLAALKSQNVHNVGTLFKMYDDPRVTRLGRVLRRYSLDELPQLLNVVAGQMSLVGPRPPLPAEVSEYESPAMRRLLVKPGITGLWQVSGRSDLSWAESVRLDLRYVENWSPALDLGILWKTAAAVVRGSGAY